MEVLERRGMTAVFEQAHLAASVGWTGRWQRPEQGVYLWPLQKVRAEGIQGQTWGGGRL